MAARCRSQSSKDSTSGMTGAFERRPCLTALTLDAALPRSVFGPRLAIESGWGVWEEKATTECHSKCGALLDRLNSFGKFGGRNIHTVCIFAPQQSRG